VTLWLLRPVEGLDPWANCPWDCLHGVVVRAPSEAHARNLATTERGDEGSGPWLDPSLTTCVELLPEGADGVILADFVRG
jgi:hypothetical protein